MNIDPIKISHSENLLLYSGGIDSMICLKLLKDQGMIPDLLHLRTDKITEEEEQKICTSANLLSPKSSYTVIQSTDERIWLEPANESNPASNEAVTINVNFKKIYPLKYCVHLYVGFRKEESYFLNHLLEIQAKTDRVHFPLENWTNDQVKAEFKTLPVDIRKLVVSERNPAEIAQLATDF